MAARRLKFSEYPRVHPELDLVHEDDRITHVIADITDKMET